MEWPSTPLLVVDGEVEAAVALSVADFATIAGEYQIPDVSAIEPNRKGAAVWLSGVLALARVKPSATHLTLHASADDFHASIPLAAVADRGMLIYALDGRELPVSAGGPVRFLIRDYLSCHSAEIDECANVKFVDRIELTAGPGKDNRPHDDASHAALHGKA